MRLEAEGFATQDRISIDTLARDFPLEVMNILQYICICNSLMDLR